MRSRWQWLVLQFSRRLWVGAGLFAVLGAASVFLANVVSPLLPERWSMRIEADTLETILQILASSMLVVATFSLSTMLQAYAAASTATTPRVARILMGDRVAQVALSTVIGAFLFSLVGILALGVGLYDTNGRLVLFASTVVVIVLVVVTFIGWIDHATQLGRVGYGIERTAEVAIEALVAWRRSPHFGARPPIEVPDAALPVASRMVGYLQYLDVRVLQEVAEDIDGRVHVTVLPGALVDPQHPVAYVEGATDEAVGRRIQTAFTIASSRSFEQDPRFGLVVLSEIAEKALSPGINDAGTAIEVLAALHRVLATWCEVEPAAGADCDRVHLPTHDVDDLVDDAFASIAAAGAGKVSLGIRLQKTLMRLAALDVPDLQAAVRRQSMQALARAEVALDLETDIERLRRIAGASAGH